MEAIQTSKVIDNINKQDSYYRVSKKFDWKFVFILFLDVLIFLSGIYFFDKNEEFRIYLVFLISIPAILLLLYVVLQNRLIEVRGGLLLIWKFKKNKDLEILKSEIENISINYNIEPNKYSGAKTNAYTKMYGDNMPAYITMFIKLYDSRVLNFRIREDIASYFRQELKEFSYPLEEIIKNKRP